MNNNDIETLDIVKNKEYEQLCARAEQEKQFALSFVVNSDDAMQVAGEHVTNISRTKKFIVALIGPIKKAQDAAKKKTLQQERGVTAPLAEADKALREKMVSYKNKQDNIAREQQQKALAEARRVEETKQLNRAARMENIAATTNDPFYTQQAEQILNAKPVEPVVPVSETTKVAGVSFKKPVYDAHTYDMQALAAAVGRGEVDVQALTPNKSWLRTEAKQRGYSVEPGQDLCPGVRLVVKDGGMVVNPNR